MIWATSGFHHKMIILFNLTLLLYKQGNLIQDTTKKENICKVNCNISQKKTLCFLTAPKINPILISVILLPTCVYTNLDYLKHNPQCVQSYGYKWFAFLNLIRPVNFRKSSCWNMSHHFQDLNKAQSCQFQPSSLGYVCSEMTTPLDYAPQFTTCHQNEN